VSVRARDHGEPFSGSLNPPLPTHPATGGYGLPILAAVFDAVGYDRVGRHNQWTLELHKDPHP